MNNDNFKAKLTNLMQKVSSLPKDKQEELIDVAITTQHGYSKLFETVETMQQRLSVIRPAVKYLAFDLEATRRENNYLRKMLEQGRSDEA